MKKTLLLITLLAFSLFSCNDVSDFLFETEQSVEVRSIDNGAILSGGESFPLYIYSERAVVPEYYTVVIIDSFGESWGETTVEIENPEEEYTSSLIVPEELDSGKYIFYITVFENEIEIASHEVTFFKTDTLYTIDELVSMPHETGPGMDIFIKSDVTYPEETDPFFRWSVNGETYDEGLLSDGLDTLYWIAGDDPGLYSISLELFPEKCDDDYISTVSETVEIIVTDNYQEEKLALSPEEDYSLLYHFNGNLKPVDSEEFVTSLFGDVGAIPSSHSFFYTLTGNSGLSAIGEFIPYNLGVMTPFSINARISALNPIESGPILRVMSGENFNFELLLDDTGHLSFHLDGHSSTSLFTVVEMTSFSLQIIPRPGSTEVRWFVEGIPGGSDILMSATPSLIMSEQRIFIGGDDVVESAGIALDELGIFIGSDEKSTVDSQQFAREKSNQLGSDLIDADGFDGVESGSSVQSGVKHLITEFNGTLKDLETVLAFEDLDSTTIWDIVLEDVSGEEILRIPRSMVREESDDRSSVTIPKVRFTLSGSGDEATVVVNNDELTRTYLKSYMPGHKYSLFLETHVDNNSDVILDYYIIYTITDSLLPDSVATVEEEEDLL